MKFRKCKAISLLIFVCFLINILCPNSYSLSTASMNNGLIGIQHKDMGRIKIAIASELRDFLHITKNGMLTPVNFSTLKTMIREKIIEEKTIFQPAKTHIFYTDAELKKDGIHVMCRVEDEYGERTYYAVFNFIQIEELIAPTEENFPTNDLDIKVYTERQYKQEIEPLEEDIAAVAQYIQHEEGIDKVIRYTYEQTKLYEETNGEEGEYLVAKPAKEVFDYKKVVLGMLKKLEEKNVTITTPPDLIPIEDRNFSLIKLTPEIKSMIRETPAKIMFKGHEIEVYYNGHSSNNNMHAFVSEETFDLLTNPKGLKGVKEQWINDARDGKIPISTYALEQYFDSFDSKENKFNNPNEQTAYQFQSAFYEVSNIIAYESGAITGQEIKKAEANLNDSRDTYLENEMLERYKNRNNIRQYEKLEATVINLDENLVGRDYSMGSEDDIYQMVELKNKTSVSRVGLKATMAALDSLFDSNPIAFVELVRKARNPQHEFSPGAKEELEKSNLLNPDGDMHSYVRNIILSAVVGEGADTYISSPLAESDKDETSEKDRYTQHEEDVDAIIKDAHNTPPDPINQLDKAFIPASGGKGSTPGDLAADLDTDLTTRDYAAESQKSTFQIGGVNTNNAIQNLTELNGLPIEEIENRALYGEPGMYGFIGLDETLVGVLIKDNTLVQEKGFTHQELALPLSKAMEIGAGMLEYNGRKYNVEEIPGRGVQHSIFNDDIEGAWAEYKVTDIATGASIKFFGLLPEYIKRYGFYEGDVPNRVDPLNIINLFFSDKMKLGGENPESGDAAAGLGTNLETGDYAAGDPIEPYDNSDYDQRTSALVKPLKYGRILRDALIVMGIQDDSITRFMDEIIRLVNASKDTECFIIMDRSIFPNDAFQRIFTRVIKNIGEIIGTSKNIDVISGDKPQESVDAIKQTIRPERKDQATGMVSQQASQVLIITKESKIYAFDDIINEFPSVSSIGINKNGSVQISKQIPERPSVTSLLLQLMAEPELKEHYVLTALALAGTGLGEKLTPPVDYYTVFTSGNFYLDKEEFQEDKVEYWSRLKLNWINDNDAESYIQKVYDKIQELLEKGKSNGGIDSAEEVIVQLPLSEKTPSNLYLLTDMGVRVMTIDLTNLKYDKKRKQHRMNLYYMMLLARWITPKDIENETLIYHTLQLYINALLSTSKGDLKAAAEYITDITDNNIEKVIKGILFWKKPEELPAPDLDALSRFLKSA